MAELSMRGVADRLHDILRAEKAALLSADYGAIAANAAEKERLSSVLEKMLLDPSNAALESVFRKRFAAIASLAQENENLLRSAKNGVVAARARIKEIINRQRNIGVYSETGERPPAPNASVTRQKFA